ncbi:MAG: PAS domain S-box protein, partial [Verrucomicrobiales bacterium]|nr:PAS domain S-box protein [Verrucomicrobiales bacterium]
MSRRIIEMLALLAMAYAAAAVVVRVTAPWSGWVSAIKPAFGMALHNGLLIFILGLALFGLFCCAERRSAQIFVGAASVVGAILGLVALLRPWVELPVEFEQWVAALAPHAGGPQPGRMSPHTGAIVLCLALGLGLLLRAPATAQWRRYAAFGLGAVALGGCAVTLVGFAVGAPLPEDSGFSRLRWSSALGYALLAIGLMLAAFTHNWLLESLLPHQNEDFDRAALRRFQRGMALALIGLATGLGIVSFHFLRKEKANLRARAEQELTAVAQLKAAQVADWRADRLREANLVFYTPYAGRRALDVLNDPHSEVTRNMFLGWLRPLMALGPYAQALLLDGTFQAQLAYPENADRRLTTGERAAVKSAILFRKVMMADLEQSECDPEQVFLSLAVPIIVRREGDRDNVPAAGLPPSTADRAAAVLLLRADARPGLFALVSAWPTRSATAEVLLVRREPKVALALNPPRHLGHGPMQLQVPLTRSESPLVQAAIGREAAFSARDYRDEPVLVVTQRVPQSDWSLLVKVDAQEIYAPIRERGLGVGLLFTALLVATGMGLSLLWKRRDIEWLRHQVETEHERLLLAQQLHHLMRHANDIILLTDDQWRILDANERALETYGYTLEELRGMRAPDLRVASERAGFAPLEEEFRRTGELRTETVHQRKDGSTFPVEASVRRVRVDGSEQIFIILRDISERKQAEQALRESEERFRLLAEASLAGIYLFRSDRFVYVNPAFAAIFGYRPEEIVGRLGPLDLVHPDDRPLVIENI